MGLARRRLRSTTTSDPRSAPPGRSRCSRGDPGHGRAAAYRVPSARRDVLAGVTVAALAIPSAMAYAEVAGLSPVNGLYAVLLPMVAYMLLGSSRQLVIGPDGSISTLVGAAVLPLAVAGSAARRSSRRCSRCSSRSASSLAWMLRLGWIADYFSRPVLIGYIHGVAVILVIGQLGKLLGLSIDARDPLPQLWEVIPELGDVSGATVAVCVRRSCRSFVLRASDAGLPAALIVVAARSGSRGGSTSQRTASRSSGRFPSGLPSFDVPTPALRDIVTSCRPRSASSSSRSRTRS